MRMRFGWFTWAASVVIATGAVGCVERTARIQSDPPGAIVVVNDEEVGVTPAKFHFLWYGEYEIMLRKPGFDTVATSHRLEAPWWQYPPFDIVTEVILPFTIRDEHQLPVYALMPTSPPSPSELTERATEMRERSLYEGP